ncbi:hypothetical protein JIG36_27710 [Actinoplanes sp. LDG1-06]|uniref:Secreted protein n=1 Tax=Paractinoplanes ovalisporus TaxID=2810368 RepID=A0ABS2AHN9_9ACTN|nr:hypothetical protein [Actinoplanes ovalisporus]MBM2619344.1 hypothetical protein [Actinoplanes ovalisporus]
MSAERMSRWRRWARLPVVALLFAASVVAATPQAAQAGRPVPVPSVLQAVIVPASHTSGLRPDLQVVDRGGHDRVAPHPAGPAWLSEWAGFSGVTWWQLRRDGDGYRSRAGRAAWPIRGPPGRRAPDASS